MLKLFIKKKPANCIPNYYHYISITGIISDQIHIVKWWSWKGSQGSSRKVPKDHLI